MATRLWQTGWELGLLEADSIYGAGGLVLSSTKTYTGTYAARFGSSIGSYGKVIPATAELRAAMMLNHTILTITGTQIAIIFRLIADDGTVFRLAWLDTGDVITLTKAGVTQASVPVTTNDFSAPDRWRSCTIAFKADASAGWFKFYVDGLLTLSFEGNTGTSGIVAVQFCGTDGSTGWAPYCYIDDCYIEDTTGEAARAATTRRFLLGLANGNGVASDWMGSDGNQTSNYLLVDETTTDSDTTYVVATATDLVDSYACADVTVPEGYAVAAVIPTVLARKSDVGVDTELKMRLTKSGSDSTSAAKDLPLVYGPIWERYTTLPDSSAKTQANVNLCEVGIVSAGSYA